MSALSLVEFRAVDKRYGDGPLVLSGVDLSVASGDFVSLIGPSGCGKSTLLRLIAGLSPISGGTLTIDGCAPDQSVTELGFVFQEPTLLPWLTVAKNIELAPRLRGIGATTRTEARHHALDLVRLGDKAGAYPRQLSGGQKMRVSIARALSLSPKILLLDEPFGALDEMTREHLNEELLTIREQQRWTAFFVTHSVTEAVFLSNRILVMSSNPGRVHREVIVGLPYPRTRQTRLSVEYHELVRLISGILHSVETTAV